MNLHQIVSGVISAVNPLIVGTLYASTGPTTVADDGSQSPTFAPGVGVNLQVQALTGSELRHLDMLNQQGVMRAVYINGPLDGVDRPAGKGGDILSWLGNYWLVTQVLEPWNDSAGWTKVAATLQNGKPAGLP
jgi:hypothetical protein